MPAHTASSLEQTLKSIYEPQFKKAFDMEIQDLHRDMKRDSRRQVYGILDQPYTMIWNEPTVSPQPLHARQARQDQMVRQLAARKNKPSYRQRQKNGRAGRK